VYLDIHTTTKLAVTQSHKTHCNTLQHTATHCNTLQHTTTRQHIATHCNNIPCTSISAPTTRTKLAVTRSQLAPAKNGCNPCPLHSCVRQPMTVHHVTWICTRTISRRAYTYTRFVGGSDVYVCTQLVGVHRYHYTHFVCGSTWLCAWCDMRMHTISRHKCQYTYVLCGSSWVCVWLTRMRTIRRHAHIYTHFVCSSPCSDVYVCTQLVGVHRYHYMHFVCGSPWLCAWRYMNMCAHTLWARIQLHARRGWQPVTVCDVIRLPKNMGLFCKRAL